MQNLIMNVRVATDVRLFIHDGSNDVAKFNVFYGRGRDKEPIFFSASLFGKKAHTAADYFRKNMELTIRCELQPVSYTKKESNVEVKTFELLIRDFQMHGKAEYNVANTSDETTTKNENPFYKDELEDELEDEIIE